MKKIIGVGILFLFALFLASPVFAQEAVEELTVPEEETTLTGLTDEGVITGDVVSLDLDAGTITVKTDDGTENTFSVVDGDTILWKGIEDIGLSDIAEGEEAEVGYYSDETGGLIASWVDVLIEEDLLAEEIISLEEAESAEEESPAGPALE